MADEEQKHEKPQLVLANTRRLTFEDCLNMYRRLMGKEPTPADVEKARKTWDSTSISLHAQREPISSSDSKPNAD